MEAIPLNQRFLLQAKMNGTQRRALLSPRRMHCLHKKGTSRAEVTSNSEKIKLIALANVELHKSEGINR